MSTQLVSAQVESIYPLTDSILQLSLVPERYIPYQAGQYLQIILAGERFSYSIANAPLGARSYELHIRHSKDNPYNQALLSHIQHTHSVNIEMPLGHCYVSCLHPVTPIMFIAGGTGFAPIKAMIEQLLANDDRRSFELFWGARSQGDLYMDDKVQYWQKHVQQFKYVSLLSGPGKETLASLVKSRHTDDLCKWQYVISGPLDMVHNIKTHLLENGVLVQNMFSDAFDSK